MRIQYCSDLHLEFDANNRFLKDNPLPISGEILVLAGDITPLHDEYLNDSFFSYISENYKQVYWVTGNHEFYHKDINEFSKSFNIRLRSNISIVNNTVEIYNGTRFIFSTLWSEISKKHEKEIELGVSDFDCIYKNNKKIKVPDFNRLHNECLSFIKDSCNEKFKRTVIVTHHLPSNLCNSPEHETSAINEAFCVDLTEFIKQCEVNFWIYGHSHFNNKPIIIGKTVLLTNQLGYVHLKEQKGFRENAYFSI